MKVIFATPSNRKPVDAYFESLEASVKLIIEAGWEEGFVAEIENPYISQARSAMLRKALTAGADVIVFLDHDLSWEPSALLALIETPGDVVAGTYRFKKDEEEYMGAVLSNTSGTPLLRSDGCIKADRVPAGFLKVTKEGVDRFMTVYPHLTYGPKYNLFIDLFNHGAHKGIWFGEDYAFSRNWVDMGEELVIVPNLNINHHSPEKSYPGNFHKFLLRQPGGSEYAP